MLERETQRAIGGRLTRVAYTGPDSITALEKELYDPGSNISRRTGHADELPCSTTHFVLYSIFSFFSSSFSYVPLTSAFLAEARICLYSCSRNVTCHGFRTTNAIPNSFMRTVHFYEDVTSYVSFGDQFYTKLPSLMGGGCRYLWSMDV